MSNQTMQAIQAKDYGGPEVLNLRKHKFHSQMPIRSWCG